MDMKSTNYESELYSLINAIPRVDVSSLTPEIFFERYRKTGKPVVITGMLKDEAEWNLDYLCEKLGDRQFFLRNYGSERYKHDKRNWSTIGSGVELQSHPFNEYAEMLRNRQAHENHIFLGKGSITNTPLADTPSFKYLGEKLGLTKHTTGFNLYMGPGGHVTNLHYDIADGTLMQLYGAKKVVLFPPSATSNLYPFPIYTHLRHGLKLRCWYSQVDIEKPDLQSFPKFKQALQHQQEVILNQGETLYIPAYWWHEVTSLGEDMVCSVNRFWRVYPTSRAIFSWNLGRAILGNMCALPYFFMNLATAIFSSNKKQKLNKVLYKI